MKRKLLTILLLGVSFIITGKSAEVLADNSGEEAAKVESNWSLTRTEFEATNEGLLFKQTEMGTPDNHAISILNVPFDNTDSFEITFSVTMDEYVSSGRSANDVWAGIGIMGVPKFINWRNSATYGYAKDSPGLFTRFFNYSGDLRYESSVYQEDYHTTGRNDPNSDVVDTWQLYSGNGSCSITSDITFKLAYDGESGGKNFYNTYLNGNLITSEGEAAFIDKEIIFPENKIYLLVVMNTQEDDFNQLSQIVIKSINGVSYVGNNQEDPSSQSSEVVESTSETSEEIVSSSNENISAEEPNNKGCKGEAGTMLSPSILFLALLLNKKRKL